MIPTPSTKAKEDRLNERGARQLARQIARYWTSRGGVVDVRIEMFTVKKESDPLWGIRSDLVNGLPRSWMVDGVVPA